MEAAGIGTIITGILLILIGIPLILIIVYRAYINGAYSNNLNTTTTTTVVAGLNLLVIITK